MMLIMKTEKKIALMLSYILVCYVCLYVNVCLYVCRFVFGYATPVRLPLVHLETDIAYRVLLLYSRME